MPIANRKISPDGKKKKLVWNDNGTKRIVDTSANELPSVSSNDNGKLLGVDSGKWKAVNAPSGLPTVSGSDNGKFLGVSSGEWSVVSAPSGGGVLNVTDTAVEDLDNSQLVHTLNKTFTEIKTAFLAGSSVIVSQTMTGEEDGDTWRWSGYGKVVSLDENYTNDVFDNGSFYISGISNDMLVNFSVTSESGYPVYNQAIT